LRVAPHARVALADAEAAEAAQLDLLARLERLDDALEDGVDHDLGLLLREAGLLRDLLHELGLGHSAPGQLIILGNRYQPLHDGRVRRRPRAAVTSTGRQPSDSSPAPTGCACSSCSASSSSMRALSSSVAARTTAASRTAAASFLRSFCFDSSSSISSLDGCETPRMVRPTLRSWSSMRRMRARTQSPARKWSSRRAPDGTSISLTCARPSSPL